VTKNRDYASARTLAPLLCKARHSLKAQSPICKARHSLKAQSPTRPISRSPKHRLLGQRPGLTPFHPSNPLLRRFYQVPPAPLHQTPPPAPAAEATGQEAMLPQPAELLRVKSAASIRNGPSGSAKVIGTASTGAEIEVKAREGSWVQFVDPSSGNTGWIHSSSVAPSTTAATADSAATQAAEESPPADGPRPKTVKQRPKGAAQIAKKQSPNFSAPTVKGDGRSPKAYVELPSDGEFLPPRKRGRLGILERRRMLREGLMSPDFLPPR